MLLVGCFVCACSTNTNPTELSDDQIQRLPDVPVPADNPITAEKVILGRNLFYDKGLSSDGTIACASCHSPSTGFSDAPNQISAGVEGRLGNRNSPTIVNAAYRTSFFWDGRAKSLEEQAFAAFSGSVEMNADTMAVMNRMRGIKYRELWVKAFGDTSVSIKRVMQAIATFERTVISANSRYDKFIAGNNSALSTVEKDGMRLFFSSRTMCSSCHGGFDFTDNQFHNVGLFHHYFDLGKYNVTFVRSDEALFKTPSLRNVALTAPYMATGEDENGIMSTLEQVIDHYNDGGTNFFNKDKRVKKLGLTDYEKKALVEFMLALTDSTVLSNPSFAKP